MANTPDYSWPPMEKRKVIGQRYKRLDGPVKASGRAKYSSDYLTKDLLFGAYNTCPHAHARVLSVDTSEAEKIKGVMAVHVVSPAGTEVQWSGAEIAAVAATSTEIAWDAVRKIKVEYEVLPHLVNEIDLTKAGTRAKAAGEKITGDPDKAFQDAELVSEGHYGIPVINHNCLETHGSVTQWQGDGDNSQIHVWPSTQDVTHYAGSLAPNLKVPAANIHVRQDHVGGGFGSKFTPDSWGAVAAWLSKKAGGRPVKLFLDRATEQKIAGNRPSAYGRIRIGGTRAGLITAWESETWATGGFTSGGPPPLPYIISAIPNQRLNHKAVSTNIGPSCAWRAPNNQQASYMTCAAVEDFAAKAGLDPLEVFKLNARYTPEARRDTYLFHFDKAAEMADWKKLWHPRGQSGVGGVKHGLGIGFNAWAGLGHQSQCRVTLHADGSVNVDIGTQDLGTGTRTIITQVAAESLGLTMNQIRLAIGSSDLPPDSASGGSTTVGGVSSSTRKASLNALAKLYEQVAPSMGVEADQLEAVDGHIRVKGAPNKSITWQAACRRIPASGVISEIGETNPRNPMGLMAGGVAGVQIANVSVDTETGIVKVNRYVAVQDCGMIINPRLSESVCYGAISQGISTALFEQRYMDDQTGMMLNPNMEFYKLAGIADVGDIVVHMDIRPENDKRGVVGLGEPPAVAICAAIGNAVANAIGVRVPHIPMTPRHVLAVLEGRTV